MKKESEIYLKRLQNLNLYTPDNIYSIDNNKLVDSISTVTSLLSNDTRTFANSLTSRLLQPNTPLQQIATVELAKAFTRRIGDVMRTSHLPTVTTDGLNVMINQPLSYWHITEETGDKVSDILKFITGYISKINPVPDPKTFKLFEGDDGYHKVHDQWLKDNRGQGQKDSYQSNVSKNKYQNDLPDSTYGKGSYSTQEVEKNGLNLKSENVRNDNNLQDGYPGGIDLIGNKLHPSAIAFNHITNDGNKKLISRGGGTFTDDSGEKFLRVFTTNNRYDSTNDLLKYKHGAAGSNSVLQTVFPRIFPTHENDYKNLMLSITNLAQNSNKTMWFVPYNLNFNEAVNVGWNRVDFLGRNEPIYTYSGSERTGVISFTLIADYPAELDNIEKWKNKTNNEFDKYFRQDNDIVEYSKNNKEVIEVNSKIDHPIEEPKSYEEPINPFPLNGALRYYFDNNDATLKNNLKDDNLIHSGQIEIDSYKTNISDLVTFLDSPEGYPYRLVLDGNSSSLASSEVNLKLSYDRAKAVLQDIQTRLENKLPELPQYNGSLTNSILKNDKIQLKASGEKYAINQDSSIDTIKRDVVDRFVAVYLEFNPNNVEVENPRINNEVEKVIIPQDNTTKETTLEEHFFKPFGDNVKLTDFNREKLENNLIKTYGERIEYFNPVYHSQTPIDLNKRVTFLQQCTRQGNTVFSGDSIDSQQNYGNSIFGTPPVCELRLGDYLNTKILIQNLSLNYHPLWDNNPEGIGMQPMICDVDITCIILGGSSLEGPIKNLQNALTTNYYANAEVYNKK